MRLTTVALLACFIAGCASTPQPTSPPAPETVALLGTEEDQRRFAGLWRGTLDAVDDRLDGPIEFRLQPGEVLFSSEARTPRRILWIRVTEGKLAGATDTWLDPERKVRVYTTFEAVITEGTMRMVVRDKVGTTWTDVATVTASRVAD